MDRPAIGQKVTFNALPRKEFCKKHIQNGAMCEVVANWPNTVIVRFAGQKDTDIVSPVYLKGRIE